MEGTQNSLHDRAIGEIIGRTNQLTVEQVEKVLAYQKETGLRFGEAAVALGFVSNEEVLFALAQQFHYPYSPVDKQKLNPELVSAVQPFSKQAEAFRAIRGQVLLRAFPEGEPKRALAVISANTGDGKTFFAANLAIVLAQIGGRVLLVDADLRGPRQHEVFGIENTLGLSGVLSGRAEQQVIRQIADLPSLYLLPGGAIPPNPIELVERPAFGLLIKELVSKFDYVIVDTPAAFYGADASAVALKCGAALCVARQGKSKMSGIQDLLATISAGTVKLAGVIMNEY
jgi:protein-tyrosine kinase